MSAVKPLLSVGARLTEMLLRERYAVLHGVGEPSHDGPVAPVRDDLVVERGLGGRLGGQSRFVLSVDEDELVYARAGQLVGRKVDGC